MAHTKDMYHYVGSVYKLLPEIRKAGMDIHKAIQTDASGIEPDSLKKSLRL